MSKEQKLLLAFTGYVVDVAMQYRPTAGFIVTLDGQKHRINLNSLYPKIISTVDELLKMISKPLSDPPKLFLNANCPLCQFRDYCHKEAEVNDNLSLLGKMTQKVMRRYEEKGIFTIKQLSYIFNPRKRRKKSVTVKNIFSFELQALALRTEKIYLHETPLIPINQVELFIDIEGIPDQGFNYLIGLIVVSQDEIKNYSFWADSKEEEEKIFKNFITIAESYSDAPIYHYGSYEPKAFSLAEKTYGLNTTTIKNRFVNVNSYVYGKVYFPSKSNRLKDLGALVGAIWESPEASGLQSLVWRYQWEENYDDQLKQILVRYNYDDCNALKCLLYELRNIGNVALSRNDIDFHIKPKKISTEKGSIIHDQLKNVIISSYLDKYKSNRIKINSKDDYNYRKNINNKGNKRRKIKETGGITINVPMKLTCSSNCKMHTVLKRKTDLFPTGKIVVHSIIELFFTKSGCKKSIVRYIGEKSHCRGCNTNYVPPIIHRMHGILFGHQFQSWIVNQRIVLRQSLEQICMQSKDMFNVELSKSTAIGLFNQIYIKYVQTEKRLLGNILSSKVIHVDETKLNIIGTNQFAWVLTDGIHVIFWLTKTRETTVLQEILKDYNGILVSDFYAGYDIFSCKQQKCIVHLLGDINDDLWQNPFNKQFEDFVAIVRDLFIKIFYDVHKYGLKERHLRKHIKSVDLFYKKMMDVKLTCELVEKYRKRFGRYRESLFTFLTGDGIAWENNMAERALRHLAIQRKISGSFTKDGAEKYLLLLGIAQSCRFQNKSFLRFLLSGEIDVDNFNEKKHPPKNKKANI